LALYSVGLINFSSLSNSAIFRWLGDPYVPDQLIGQLPPSTINVWPVM